MIWCQLEHLMCGLRTIIVWSFCYNEIKREKKSETKNTASLLKQPPIKEDYPKNLQVVFCPEKLCSFEPFMCLAFATMSQSVGDNYDYEVPLLQKRKFQGLKGKTWCSVYHASVIWSVIFVFLDLNLFTCLWNSFKFCITFDHAFFSKLLFSLSKSLCNLWQW